jgi:hypothetical protein
LENLRTYTCMDCGFTAKAVKDADNPWSDDPFRPPGLPPGWLCVTSDGMTCDEENLVCPKCAAEFLALLRGKPH